MKDYYCDILKEDNFFSISIYKAKNKDSREYAECIVRELKEEEKAPYTIYAYGLFETLGVIERNKHKVTTIYHNCGHLYDWLGEKSYQEYVKQKKIPLQAIAFKNRLERLKRKGFDIRFTHFNDSVHMKQRTLDKAKTKKIARHFLDSKISHKYKLISVDDFKTLFPITEINVSTEKKVANEKTNNKKAPAGVKITSTQSIKEAKIQSISNLIEEEAQLAKKGVIAITDKKNRVIDYISKRKAKKLSIQGSYSKCKETYIQDVKEINIRKNEILDFLNVEESREKERRNIDKWLPFFMKKTILMVDRDLKYKFVISKKIAEKLIAEEMAFFVGKTKDKIRLIHDRKTFNNYIKLRDNSKCIYCKNKGTTIEHKLAKKNGGITSPKNCACACVKCNSNKSDLTMVEYLEKVVNK